MLTINKLTKTFASGSLAIGVATLASLAGSTLIAPSAQAATFNLGDLITNGGSIIVGDKLFDNFTGSRTGTGTPISFSDINVNTLDTLNYGIQFQAGFSADAGNTVDFLIGYDVTVLDPTKKLTDIELLYNGSFTGDGRSDVTETVTNLDPLSGPTAGAGALLAQISVTNPPLNLANSVDLAFPTKKLSVLKDIFLTGGTNGNATISFINQRFSQTSVPEPSAVLGLLAVGGLGLVSLRRKQS